MTRRPVILGLLGALALAQLGVPLGMIVQQEQALRLGHVFRFRTAPVDPFDALRGRYVALDFEETNLSLPCGAEFESGEKAYAHVEVGPDGFAHLTEVVRRRPEDGGYIPVRIRYAYGSRLYIALPFDRYYLEEALAPEAEAAYRERSRAGARDAYVTVRLWKGLAVLEELYVGGKPIRQFLEEAPEQTVGP